LLGTDVGLQLIESAVAACFKQAHASNNFIDGIDIRKKALKIPSH
jgi:hypothetical protein